MEFKEEVNGVKSGYHWVKVAWPIHIYTHRYVYILQCHAA